MPAPKTDKTQNLKPPVKIDKYLLLDIAALVLGILIISLYLNV